VKALSGVSFPVPVVSSVTVSPTFVRTLAIWPLVDGTQVPLVVS